MDNRVWAIIVWGCNAVSYFTLGGASIIGLIIAYVKRSDLRGTIYESHMTSAIRTFWISFAGFWAPPKTADDQPYNLIHSVPERRMRCHASGGIF